MTITPEVHQRFVDELTAAFGDRADSVEVIPDMLVNAHQVLVKRGQAYVYVPVSDHLIEDDPHRAVWVGLVVDTMTEELDALLA